MRQLRKLADHARAREFPQAQSDVDMLRHASAQIAQLTADWIRVGFVQGNFNSDNCLISGRTMDYGPFGFMEPFMPLYNFWSGGGEHFGFLVSDTEVFCISFSFICALRVAEPAHCGGQEL